ncbi:hypothetical protein EUGRSUZ_A00767 [Eucalyptus grandis]|uniref:Uncharacterized protein n=2 Tax=Eucalyptus grandis TaxID=71139 RepID=A0ACC3M214_EUCGR|nr:hypothetical protein EUGRSUZ_A00767 [Eucalyptus grandis]
MKTPLTRAAPSSTPAPPQRASGMVPCSRSSPAPLASPPAAPDPLRAGGARRAGSPQIRSRPAFCRARTPTSPPAPHRARSPATRGSTRSASASRC